jgi:hypothetical protein
VSTSDVTPSPRSPLALHAAIGANVRHDGRADYLPLLPFLCLVIVLLSACAIVLLFISSIFIYFQ